MSLAQGNNTPIRPRIEPGSPDPSFLCQYRVYSILKIDTGTICQLLDMTHSIRISGVKNIDKNILKKTPEGGVPLQAEVIEQQQQQQGRHAGLE